MTPEALILSCYGETQLTSWQIILIFTDSAIFDEGQQSWVNTLNWLIWLIYK